MKGKFDVSKFTPEQLNGALACKTAEELIAFAKQNGVELTAEQAKKYLAQMTDIDVNLSDDVMKNIAGGGVGGCNGYCIYDNW